MLRVVKDASAPMTKVRSFLRDRSGATAIEYCLIAGFIALAIVAGATTLGVKLNAKFSAFNTNFS